jgi:hypothetical protein
MWLCRFSGRRMAAPNDCQPMVWPGRLASRVHQGLWRTHSLSTCKRYLSPLSISHFLRLASAVSSRQEDLARRSLASVGKTRRDQPGSEPSFPLNSVPPSCHYHDAIDILCGPWRCHHINTTTCIYNASARLPPRLCVPTQISGHGTMLRPRTLGS